MGIKIILWIRQFWNLNCKVPSDTKHYHNLYETFGTMLSYQVAMLPKILKELILKSVILISFKVEYLLIQKVHQQAL